MRQTKSKTKTKTPRRSSALDDISRQGLPKMLRNALSKADLRPGRRRTEPSRTSPSTAKRATSEHPQDPFLDRGVAVTEDACSDVKTTQTIELAYSDTQEPRSTDLNGRRGLFQGSSKPAQASRQTTSTAQTPRVGHATTKPLLSHPNFPGHATSSIQSLDTYKHGDGLQDTPWDPTLPSNGNTHIREQSLEGMTSLPVTVGVGGMLAEDAFLESSRAASTTDLQFRYTLLSGEGCDGSLSTDPLAEEVDDILQLDVPYWTEDQESGRFYHWDTDRRLLTWYPDEFD